MKIEERTKEQESFRDEIARWLNTYPWSYLWTPTFKRKEEEGRPTFTRSGGYDLKTGRRTGGGTFKKNPFWKEGDDRDLHISGFSEAAAVRATKRFLKTHMRDYSYFFVSEQNPSRHGHHVHCLLIPPSELCEFNMPVKKLGPMWWEKYGWNKFERIKSKDDVTGYCTKHVCNYLRKGAGWYEIEINDTDVFHASTSTK